MWLRKDGRGLVIVRRPTDLQLRETVGIPETRYFFWLAWSAGGCLLPGKLSLHSDKLISCTNNQAACEAGKCPKSASEAILKRDFPANPGDLATMP